MVELRERIYFGWSPNSQVLNLRDPSWDAEWLSFAHFTCLAPGFPHGLRGPSLLGEVAEGDVGEAEKGAVGPEGPLERVSRREPLPQMLLEVIYRLRH